MRIKITIHVSESDVQFLESVLARVPSLIAAITAVLEAIRIMNPPD